MVKTTTGKPPQSPEDIAVTDGEVRSWKAMKGTQAAMEALYGDDWGDEEVRRWMQDKRYEKWQEEDATVLERDSFVAERYQEYMQAFEGATPNDKQTILAMCINEAQQEKLAKTLSDAKITLADSDNIKKLHKVMTDLTTEHRQLQSALGIQRKDRKTHRETALELIRAEIERGRQFMEERLIPITHCNIQAGWILYDFQELPYEFEFTCPRCGGKDTIKGGDPEEAKKVIEGMRKQDGQQRD